MYEAPAPPKKEIPYPWIVGGLAALCVCLVVITLSSGTTATMNADALIAAQSIAGKNAEALGVAQAAAAVRERSLLTQIDTLSLALKDASSGNAASDSKIKEALAAERRCALLLSDANKRINELNVELAGLRSGSENKEALAMRRKAESDLESASAALREANAGLVAALARNAELEEENRRLREQSMRSADVSAGYRQSIPPKDDKWAKMNQDFLAKLDADPSIVKSTSGLRFKILEEGHPARPNAASSVKCRYEGKLIDGKVFDTTKSRNNEPSEFPLSGVIPSWTEGVQKIGVGGKIILYCPSALAYGDEGQGPIPGRSVLIFEVELVEITKFR
jgi:FKBP-type peptidyl-prolyl cis-trans isomerase